MAPEQIAIYGAGGLGPEIAWLVQECGDGQQPLQVCCFIDDDEAKQGKLLYGVQVMALAQARRAFPGARVVVAIGDPRIREPVAVRAAAAGFGFATLVHPRVARSGRVDVGEGTVILPGSTLTTNIVLGRHVQLNPGCTIAHGAVLGDFATLSPGVHIAGCVHLGRRVFMGTGAVTIQGSCRAPLEIGDDAVVGAGACVTKPVSPGATVVGVPAHPIDIRDRGPMAEPRPVPSRSLVSTPRQ